MTNSFQAQQTYKVAQRELTSPKEIELKVFASVTSALLNVDLKALDGRSKLASALLDNAKLWRIVFTDLVNPENPLPLPLKESLISLAEFTQSHTLKVLSGNAEHGVLIEINQSVMKGLKDSLRIKANADAKKQSEAA